ncbi:transporter suffix domain-containing protein [Paenibacillus sp. SAF-054]|uniref:transporter suffix domain-containing protein n=1 Tax=unclassified Paenibacillus TaxID=185978 RepID=UPI003F817771
MEKEMTSIQVKPKRRIFYKVGMVLLVLSLLVWLIPVITPFTPLSVKLKTGLITGSLIFAEITFWIGALLVGKEVAAKFKSYLNPKNWRKKGDRPKNE